MDTKAILGCRRKLNELAAQHNKLTTLTACLLNEIISLKRELKEVKGDEPQKQQYQDSRSSNQSQNGGQKFQNFNELRAEDILKQLSINNIEN